MHHGTHLDAFHPLMTIVTVEWFYLVHHILGGLVSPDLPRRRSCSDEQSHGQVILTPISLIIHQIWPGPAPSYSPRWLPSIDDHSHGCVILPRISLIWYHILVGLISSDAFTFWWSKAQLSGFDSYFTYYPTYTCMAGTCTIGLTSMAAIHWRPSSRLRDFTSYFAYMYITSYRRTCLEGVHALMNTVTVEWFWLVCHLWPGPAPSDWHGWSPSIDDNRHGWVSLPRISLILRQILVGLILSDLPRRRSCSDEQSHGCVILTRISLIIQQIWPGPASSNSPRRLPGMSRDFTSYCPHFTSYPRQTSIIGLASKVYTLWWAKWRLKYYATVKSDIHIGYNHQYVLI